jgi:hypothetical protein
MPIQISDIATFPEGMNLQVKPWNIPEGQARYLQDIVLHEAHNAPRRGPVTEAFSIGTELTKGAIGIVGTFQPDQTFKLAVLNGSSTSGDAKLSVLNAAHTAYAAHITIDESAVAEFLTDKRHHVSTSPHPESGIIIGTSNGLYPSSQQMLFTWAGSEKPKYSTGTITVAQDGVAVTGSGTAWLTNVDPGMYLYARVDAAPGPNFRAFIGVVKSVGSDTSITLVDGALFAVTARAYYVRPVKPVEPRVSKGTITCSTGAKKITGQGTKFSRQGLATGSNSGAWAIFRADDMKYVGRVDTVQSDIQLTLGSNALQNCNRDKYVAIDIYTERDSVLTQLKDPGFLNARWANRTWYANRGIHGRQTPLAHSRVFFSDVIDAEALDTTSDGDHFPIPSTVQPLKPITGMVATSSCLLITKQDETYGVFGSDPSNFQVKKICDDGAISNMTIQPWNEGVIWAGMKGIWFWDGSEATNIIEDRIGDYYQKSLETLDPAERSAWAMVYKNNYVVHIEGGSPYIGPVFDPDAVNDENPGATPEEPLGYEQDHLSIAVNLERRAVSFQSNLGLRGSVITPFEETLGTLYLVNKTQDTDPWAVLGGRICSASDLFYSTGLDTIRTQVPDGSLGGYGPNMYIESKRYDMQQPQLKKRLKQLQMMYNLESITGDYVTLGYVGDGVTDFDNNYLKFATMVGLNELSTESNSKWRLTRVKNDQDVYVPGYQNKRIKFNKRSQHIGFRIWQSNTTGIKSVKVGPMAIGWRPMRPGRV